MVGIRKFRRDDVPGVAALRLRAFSHTHHHDQVALEAYVNRVFFDNPWYDADFPSLVHENAEGKITGFLGVISRPMGTKGGQIRVAVPTQFMVDPAARGMEGILLLKTFLAGRQDLAVADIAGNPSRDLWECLGGSTALLYCMEWSLVLRPLANRGKYFFRRFGALGGCDAALRLGERFAGRKGGGRLSDLYRRSSGLEDEGRADFRAVGLLSQFVETAPVMAHLRSRQPRLAVRDPGVSRDATQSGKEVSSW